MKNLRGAGNTYWFRGFSGQEGSLAPMELADKEVTLNYGGNKDFSLPDITVYISEAGRVVIRSPCRIAVRPICANEIEIEVLEC